MATAGDLGTLPRAGLSVPWFLVFVRVHYSGGSGTAALALSIDGREPTQAEQNVTLYPTGARGTGTDFNFVVPETEYAAWSFTPDEQLILTWSNPDAGNMVWAATIGVAPESAIIRGD